MFRSEWKIKDILDFEYLLPSTAEQDGDEHVFDRNTYRDCVKDYGQKEPSRPTLLKYWLESKRENEAPSRTETASEAFKLPSEVYEESLGFSRLVLGTITGVVGAGLAGSLLVGEQPLNVMTCLWVLLVPQIVLLLLLGLTWTARVKRIRFLPSLTVIYPLLSRLMRSLFLRVKSGLQKRLPAHQYNKFQASLGFLGQTQGVYGSIVVWPVFRMAQFIGICFNVGILFVMLLLGTIKDLNFGWESTWFEAGHFEVLADVISLPWFWLSAARMSSEHVAGSEMGIQEPVAAAMEAWLPFLCLAVLFYGLLPRLILLGVGAWKESRDLGEIRFTHNKCERLISRMKTPVIGFTNKGKGGTTRGPEREKRVISQQPIDSARPSSLPPAVVLVPVDIQDNSTTDALEECVRGKLGLYPARTEATNFDIEEDVDSLQPTMSSEGDTEEISYVVALMEAWQPPTKEIRLWIEGLREHIDRQTNVVVGLIGKPDGENVFTKPDNTNWQIWAQTINAIGDPYVRVENVGGE